MLWIKHASDGDVFTHHGRWHCLGDAIAYGVWVAKHACAVFNGSLCLDGSVGDDLCNMFFAVALRCVSDHVGASTFIEVNINIGHRDTFWIQEALKQQPMFEWIKISDPKCVGDHGTRCRTTTWTNANAIVFCVLHQVGNHEEVTREAHLHDDADFILGLLAHIVRDLTLVTLG